MSALGNAAGFFLPAPALPSAVAGFEDWHLAFGSLQDTANIFLVGKYHHQGYQYCEYAVKGFFFIEDKEYKNHKSHTGKNGA